jgi:DNA repair protein RecN (Recombination protein N)
MPAARFEVAVGEDDPGDEVSFLLELSRAMLAARLVLTLGSRGSGTEPAPGTLVFDEVDAGVGGQAALAVGRALAALAAENQVLVVTHLPQVAAFADHQVAVTKSEDAGRTVVTARMLSEQDRVVELSRMLSGQPASVTARGHAEELLATASKERGR